MAGNLGAEVALTGSAVNDEKRYPDDDDPAWLPEEWLEDDANQIPIDDVQPKGDDSGIFREIDTIDRACSDSFIAKLRAEALKRTWFYEVLQDPGLIVAPRGQLLNVYWLGQSIFLVKEGPTGLAVSTHPKYLLDSALGGQVCLSDGKFDLSIIRQTGFISGYKLKIESSPISSSTLEKLKASSALFSGLEKSGCHKISVHNSCVVDCEIQLPSFQILFPESESKGARIDLASIESCGSRARLVFWEAKHFSNGELRASLREDKLPDVCEQVRKYRAYLNIHATEIAKRYVAVAKNLLELKKIGWKRDLSQVIIDVAEGKRDLILEEPTVGLVIFGFDRAQRDDKVWQKHLQRLNSREAGVGPVLAAGNPKNIRLPI